MERRRQDGHGYGPGLARRREALGYRTQGELAEASQAALETLGGADLAVIRQPTLSRLEADETGEVIRAARPRTLRMLAYLLLLDREAFERHVGVELEDKDVPVLDGPRDPAGVLIGRLRRDLTLPVDEVVGRMRSAGTRMDRATYLAIETGLLPLDGLSTDTRDSLRVALGAEPGLWEGLSGRTSPIDAPWRPAPTGQGIQDGVGAKLDPAVASGHAPEPTLPLLPMDVLYPPRRLQEGEALEQVRVATEWIRPGILLTILADDPLLTPGPRRGAHLIVDATVRELEDGRVYVVQAGDRPVMVRRAGRDALGRPWLLPDVPDFRQYPPVLGRDARVIGEVLHWTEPTVAEVCGA